MQEIRDSLCRCFLSCLFLAFIWMTQSRFRIWKRVFEQLMNDTRRGVMAHVDGLRGQEIRVYWPRVTKDQNSYSRNRRWGSLVRGFPFAILEPFVFGRLPFDCVLWNMEFGVTAIYFAQECHAYLVIDFLLDLSSFSFSFWTLIESTKRKIWSWTKIRLLSCPPKGRSHEIATSQAHLKSWIYIVGDFFPYCGQSAAYHV